MKTTTTITANELCATDVIEIDNELFRIEILKFYPYVVECHCHVIGTAKRIKRAFDKQDKLNVKRGLKL